MLIHLDHHQLNYQVLHGVEFHLVINGIVYWGVKLMEHYGHGDWVVMDL